MIYILFLAKFVSGGIAPLQPRFRRPCDWLKQHYFLCHHHSQSPAPETYALVSALSCTY